MVSQKTPTGCYSYTQDVMTTPTGRRVGYIFCTASHRSSTKSPEPLTDKPHHK